MHVMSSCFKMLMILPCNLSILNVCLLIFFIHPALKSLFMMLGDNNPKSYLQSNFIAHSVFFGAHTKVRNWSRIINKVSKYHKISVKVWKKPPEISATGYLLRSHHILFSFYCRLFRMKGKSFFVWTWMCSCIFNKT